MKLLPEQTDEVSFLRFSEQAMSLLEKRDFQALADRFGYALTCGRGPVAAIEGDFESCLAEFRASPEQSVAVTPSIVVKYFQPNSSNLFALVECVFTVAEGCPLLAELIVSSSGEDKHIVLEQVSLVTA